MSSGELVISLDFELLWGVRDHVARDSYGPNILGGRDAIPLMLDLFERHGISATWATVGAVFCASRDELMDALPPEELRPRYAQRALSNYRYLHEIGRDERTDPHYFGASLVRQIATCPGQEIASHTMSHFYCLEEGTSVDSFAADIKAAVKLAEDRGIFLKSIVFPRNQYADAHLDVVLKSGFQRYRGNPRGWTYRATAGAGQILPRRLLRLADAHSGVLGPHLYAPGEANVPASRFLRPCTGWLSKLHPLHLDVIERAMTHAAKSALGFHLWWHPHNFGQDTAANIAGLERVVRCFARLRDAHGMVSRSMADSGNWE